MIDHIWNPGVAAIHALMIVLLGTSLFIGGCQLEQRANRKPGNSTTTWRTVATWTGSGIKETETFEITKREWRIAWETRNEPFLNAGLLQIMVYDDANQLVSMAANKHGLGKDTSYVHKAGKFHLMINSGNIEWSVQAEER